MKSEKSEDIKTEKVNEQSVVKETDRELCENSYNNGLREYERLCNEKTDEFKTYISIIVAVTALQCTDFFSGERVFLLPLLVVIISLIFSSMTKRTEGFIRKTRERLIDYEEKGVRNEWYSLERKIRVNKKNKVKKITLYHLIQLTYAIMCLLSVGIALFKYFE